jgi:phosphatidylethanolamine-binding protein (PEBP) family uncharacterized protein
MELVREMTIAALMLTGIVCVIVFGTQHSGHGGKAALLEACIGGNGLVPTFKPDINMQVFYGQAHTVNRTAVSCGNNLLPAMFKAHRQPPLLTLGSTDASKKVTNAAAPFVQQYYSILMIDADRHKPELPGASYLHWMVLNLNGTDPSSLSPSSGCVALPAAGETPTQCYQAVQYETPTVATVAPFLHRYYFIMYRTPAPVPTRAMATAAKVRANFNYTSFATSYFKGASAIPVGGNMFQVQYENPAGRRRLSGEAGGVGPEGRVARFWRLNGEPLFDNSIGVLWPQWQPAAEEAVAREGQRPPGDIYHRRGLFIDHDL